MEVNNGMQTSFWYDSWSHLGCLKDLLGDRGTIDLGVVENALVADVIRRHRRRRHRLSIFSVIEEEIVKLRDCNSLENDKPLWRQTGDKFANQFSTKKTWSHMRQSRHECRWSKGVWFTQSTPKFAFLVWVAIRNRLQTCDRMQLWNTGINTLCVLCQEQQETCSHLFFQCRYSGKVWKAMVGGILKGAFTIIWDEIVTMLADAGNNKTETFLFRYVFQALVHSIWRERNGRRHGEAPKDEKLLIKCVDRTIRLKLLAVKGKGKKYLEESLSTWFGSRIQVLDD